MNDNLDASLIEKIKNIKLFVMDVDGVLSDGRIIYNSYDVETKAFFVHDGLGLQLLKQNGIKLAIITGRTSAMVQRRAEELGIDHVVQGQDDKYTELCRLSQALELDLAECAYMGDDLPDLKAIKYAGFGISVPNGCLQARQAADWVSPRQGGLGAVRDACELILKAQGKYDAAISRFL